MLPETGQRCPRVAFPARCPVAANMSFDSQLVISHVAVTVIASSPVSRRPRGGRHALVSFVTPRPLPTPTSYRPGAECSLSLP